MEKNCTLTVETENLNNQKDKISIVAALFKVATNTVMDKDLTAVLFKEYDAKPVIIKQDHTIFEALGSGDKMDKLKFFLENNGLIECKMSNTVVL